MYKIAILTSSRSEYGIYKPLLKRLEKDSLLEPELVVFGTHLSRYHGYTVDEIKTDGYHISKQIDCMSLGDSSSAIATAMGATMIRFSSYWNDAKNDIQLGICLGDRFEMFSAVAASIPFNIPMAHIHGGETSLGAIDETFRHALTHMSALHFASTRTYAERIGQLKGSMENVHHVGALSLDNLESIEFFSDETFFEKFGCSIDAKTILVTLHPETRSGDSNAEYADVVATVLERLTDRKVVITMPNADTEGTLIRERFTRLTQQHAHRISVVENMGMRGYFTALKKCGIVLGNSSSGILEAGSFHKQVINIGDRQLGRVCGENVTHVPFDVQELETTVRKTCQLPSRKFENPYFAGGAANKIVNAIKSFIENHGS